jgi:hypothetical protein
MSALMAPYSSYLNDINDNLVFSNHENEQNNQNVVLYEEQNNQNVVLCEEQYNDNLVLCEEQNNQNVVFSEEQYNDNLVLCEEQYNDNLVLCEEQYNDNLVLCEEQYNDNLVLFDPYTSINQHNFLLHLQHYFDQYHFLLNQYNTIFNQPRQQPENDKINKLARKVIKKETPIITECILDDLINIVIKDIIDSTNIAFNILKK